ncbi:MAG: hypothetical protein AAF492_19520 [Verrucomicrobiota bacterium]
MKKQWIKTVSAFLIPIMFFVSAPVFTASAQDDMVQQGTFVNASSDDNDIADVILIGMGVVVLGILLWLGFKKDMRRLGDVNEDEALLAHASFTEQELERLHEEVELALADDAD